MRLTSTLTLSLLAACTPVSLDPFDPEDTGSSGGADSSSGADSSPGADEPTTTGNNEETTAEPGATTVDDTTGAPAFECDDEFVVPDPQLMASLRVYLGLADDQPIPLELAQTTESLAVSADAESLEGLQCFTGLVTLLFERGCKVKDLGPISGLKQLGILLISESAVEDLGPLSGLTKLGALDISLTAVKDLSPLAGLPALTGLTMISTDISDLGPLASTPKLSALEMGHSAVTSFAPLAGHPSLATIYASDLTGTLDPSGLATIPNLVELELDRTKLDSLDFLLGAPALRSFSAMENGVEDVSPLADVDTLVELWLSNNGITDVSPLAGLPKLELLGIDQNPLVGGLAALADAPALKTLSADNTSLVEIPAPGAAPIEMLFLGNNDITDVTPLLAYPNLLRVSVAKNQITSLAPLTDPPWSFIQIDVQKNPLDTDAFQVILPALCDAGFRMLWGNGEACNVE